MRRCVILLLVLIGASPPATRPADYYQLACQSAKSSPADALDSLQRAIETGFTDFRMIEADKRLDPLRESPRFNSLIHRKEFYQRRTAAETLTALRNRFGEEGYLYEIDDDQRLIFAVALSGDELNDLRAALKTQADALQKALFAQKPEAYITVLMPTAKDYASMIRYRNVPGIYVDESKSLVARERGFVMAHEFTHALQAGDTPPFSPQPAAWVAEGLGCLCEAADFTNSRFKPRDNPRFNTIPHGAKRKALIPLERLVTMDKRQFLKRPALTYGESSYLMLFLWEKGMLRKFYESYKETAKADPTGKTALETVSGRKLSDLQEDWRQWLMERNPPR